MSRYNLWLGAKPDIEALVGWINHEDAPSLTPAEAATRIRELRKGVRLPDGVTIKDLINYGRA